MRVLQLLLIALLLLASCALPVDEDGLETSRRPDNKKQGTRRRNKVQQGQDVALPPEAGNGRRNKAQLEQEITLSPEAADNRQNKGQREINVSSRYGKGYPDDFWVQDPELGRYQDDAPNYPYEEPRGKVPVGRPEDVGRASQANKEIDQCWAEWIKEREQLRETGRFDEEHLRVHDMANAAVCIRTVAERFGIPRHSLKSIKYIPRRYENAKTSDESLSTNPSTMVEDVTSVGPGWKRKMREGIAAVGHMLRNAWAQQKPRHGLSGTVSAGFTFPRVLAVP